MKVYLAAAWSRREEIRLIAEDLNTLPEIQVEARWLSEPSPEVWTVDFLQQRAIADVQDVGSVEVLVRFTDDLSGPTVPSQLATGARMFEMGLAYALGKTIFVVGGTQPVFDYLPNIVHVKNVEELKLKLIRLQSVANSYIEVVRG